MNFIKLSNGVKIPQVGYGTLAVSNEETKKCVLEALEIGYRHIDTAQIYGNEVGVGEAIRESGVPRSEIFLTTKVWITNAGYEKAKQSIYESLENLKVDYIDLVLVHLPFNDYYGTWRALEELYDEGRIRALGVSNFYGTRLYDLMTFAKIKPAINQVETHIFNQQQNLRKLLAKFDIKQEAWAPFAKGQNNIFTNEVLLKIGEKYDKSVGQIALKFLAAQGIVVLPKSTNKERMKENLNIFDFNLSNEEISEIEKLDIGKNMFLDVEDVDSMESFFKRMKVIE